MCDNFSNLSIYWYKFLLKNSLFLGKIIPNSPADRCGRLKAGDCLLAINKLPVNNMSHQQVVNYIKSSGNAITFTIDPTKQMMTINKGTSEEPQLMGTLKKTNENIYSDVSLNNNNVLIEKKSDQDIYFDSPVI